MEWIKITADTPLEEVQRMHRQIWDYAIEHGEKPNDCPYDACCAACEWALKQKRLPRYCCARCPIKWPDNKDCSCIDSLYDMWKEHPSVYLARQIRDLEFKTKEELC